MTVKGHQYNIYRYEGNLNGIENAVVLISFPVEAMNNPNALRAFISTNAALTNEEILNFYVNRWKIEVFFRDCKTKLAFDGYQIRSSKGIKRFWIITSLGYFIACCESTSFDFSEGFHSLAEEIRNEKIRYIYEFGKSGNSFSNLLAMVA